jgi:chromosome segregation ATPase
MGKDSKPTLEELQDQLAQATEEKNKALAARDKISEDYRMQRSESDKLKDYVGKTKKVLEEKGLAKFDENYNITIIEKKEEHSNKDLEEYDKKLQELEVKFTTLDEKQASGDIDPDKYAKEHAKLLREETKLNNKKDAELIRNQVLETSRKEFEEQKRQEKANIESNKRSLETNNFTDRLSKEFPEHASKGGFPDENSLLVQEVNLLLAENPELYPPSSVLNTDMKERYKVFKSAQLSLIAKGKLSKEDIATRQRATNSRFNTLDSGGYDPNKNKQETSYVKTSMAGSYVTNKFGADTIKDLDKSFKEYEESGTLVINS